MAARLGGWIPAYSDLTRHRKTVRVAETLRIKAHGPQAVAGYLVTLWNRAAAENTPPDGGPVPEASIEHWAEWSGKRGVLLDALVVAGFMERRQDGLYFHDWEEGGGRVVVTRHQNAERRRRARQREATRDVTRDTERDVPRDVTRLEERRGEEKRSEPPPTPSAPTAPRLPRPGQGGGLASPESPEGLVRAKHDEFHATMSEGTAVLIRETLTLHQHAEGERAACLVRHIADADGQLASARRERRIANPWRWWLKALEGEMASCGADSAAPDEHLESLSLPPDELIPELRESGQIRDLPRPGARRVI